jgi:steroid delta-isomerase-like uncharacterized protein
MAAANRTSALRYIEVVLNRKNLSLIDALFAQSFIDHDPLGPDVHGLEATRQRHAMYQTAFPDLQYTVEEVIAENNSVVLRWTAHGTHLGEIFSIAPTRKQVTIVGTMTCHITSGKIQEVWIDWDALGLLRQLGIDPQHPQPKR